MPIYGLIQRRVFAPELVTTMGEVFEDLLKTLEVSDRNDAVAELVAHKVIALVQSGERDPDRLKQLTLEAIQAQRPAS
jgi:hypothetical protein